MPFLLVRFGETPAGVGERVRQPAGGLALRQGRGLAEIAFAPIRRIGRQGSGWYYANWLWNLRGFIDLLCWAG